jgi:hypothetical protein
MARVRLKLVVASTKPIGVVAVALLGSGDLLDVLKGAHPVVLLGPVVPQTSIGWTTT